MQGCIIYCKDETEQYLVLKELNDIRFIWTGGQKNSEQDSNLGVPIFFFLNPENKRFKYCEKLVLDCHISKIYTAYGFLHEQELDKKRKYDFANYKDTIIKEFLTKWFEMCNCKDRACEKCKFSSPAGETDNWCAKELFPTNIDDLIEIVNSESPCKYGVDEFDIASDKAVKTLENYANELNSNSDLYKAILFGINEIKKASECCG